MPFVEEKNDMVVVVAHRLCEDSEKCGKVK
jgi:hypothetical protein